jgi:hypothetical protein
LSQYYVAAALQMEVIGAGLLQGMIDTDDMEECKRSVERLAT